MRKLRLALVGTLLLSGLIGCGGGSVWVVRHPRWAYDRYERLAVVPARPSTPHAAADADLLADRLTTMLAQSEIFTVLSRAELREVFAEQDLSRLADAIDEGTALPEGRIKVAQALVVPKITRYHLIRDREVRAFPVYARDKRGRRLLDRRGRPIIVGEERVPFFTHGAEVEGSVRVIDAATGRILVSHTADIAPRARTGRGRPPQETPEDIASAAVRDLAVDFYKVIAPTRVKVKLDKDMLLVATDYFDGRYDTFKEISPAWEDFLVVVRDLPSGCDRNNFRVAVAAEDGRRNLLEEEFTWSGAIGPQGVAYRIPVSLLRQEPTTKFVAKLYSVGNPEPVLTRDFRLDTNPSRDSSGDARGDDDEDEDDEDDEGDD